MSSTASSPIQRAPSTPGRGAGPSTWPSERHVDFSTFTPTPRTNGKERKPSTPWVHTTGLPGFDDAPPNVSVAPNSSQHLLPTEPQFGGYVRYPQAVPSTRTPILGLYSELPPIISTPTRHYQQESPPLLVTPLQKMQLAEESPDHDRLDSSSSLLGDHDSRSLSVDSEVPEVPHVFGQQTPHKREDPAAQRALDSLHRCQEIARGMYKKLDPCKGLVRVKGSAQASKKLAQVFKRLDALMTEPEDFMHVCGPPGVCAHEAWHETHSAEVLNLWRLLEKFAHDFSPSEVVPQRTSELEAALHSYLETFAIHETSITKSWADLKKIAVDARIRLLRLMIPQQKLTLHELQVEYYRLLAQRTSDRREK
ncbi:hypothetical protein C8F01DRAFT_1105686 [Mycena amicta]|nr:hypothetical protein C8F01DRAFT_1105686 [Mycena amicta]